MPAIRSLTVFSVLYFLLLATATSFSTALGIKTAIAIVVGFLLGFPVDRMRSLILWITESARLSHRFRTCLVTRPSLFKEKREWRFIGTVKERR